MRVEWSCDLEREENMKQVFALALCIACGFASAQTPTPIQQADTSAPQSRFERAKSKHLAHIAARIDALQKMQVCVQAASDLASLHACRSPGSSPGK
jgi:hypothetical protein